MPKQTSLQLTDATQRQATELTAAGFGKFTDIVRIAIDRMYQQECTSQEVHMESQVVVTNPFRSRKWGFGYTCQPTGNGTQIEIPGKPDYRGTLSQVSEAVSSDRVLASFRSGGTFYNAAWFYDGRRIISVPSDGGATFNEWLNLAGWEREEGRQIKSVTLTLA